MIAIHSTAVLAALLAAAPILGTIAGLVQRNTTGKTQRIAAACAALLLDSLKLADAIRGSTNPDALIVKSGTMIAKATATAAAITNMIAASDVQAGQMVSVVTPATPPAPDSSKLPGMAGTPSTKPDLTK